MPLLNVQLKISPSVYKKMAEGNAKLYTAVLRDSAGRIVDHVPIVNKEVGEEVIQKAASIASKKGFARFLSWGGIKSWVSQLGKGQKALLVLALLAVAAGLGAFGRWVYCKIKKLKGEKVNQEELDRLAKEYDDLRKTYNDYQFNLLRYLSSAQKVLLIRKLQNH